MQQELSEKQKSVYKMKKQLQMLKTLSRKESNLDNSQSVISQDKIDAREFTYYEKYSDLKKKYRELDQKYLALKGKNKDLNQTLEQTKAEFDKEKEQNMIVQMYETSAQDEKRIRELETKLLELETSNQELLKLNAELQSKIGTDKEAKLQQRCEELEKKNEEIQALLTNDDGGQFGHLWKKCNDLEQKNSRLEQRVFQLDK